MRLRHAPAPPPPVRLVCPYCQERVLVEYDAALACGFCAACGRLFPLEVTP